MRRPYLSAIAVLVAVPALAAGLLFAGTLAAEWMMAGLDQPGIGQPSIERWRAAYVAGVLAGVSALEFVHRVDNYQPIRRRIELFETRVATQRYPKQSDETDEPQHGRGTGQTEVSHD